MSKAEERALEAYPKETKDINGIVVDIGHPQYIRDFYIEGYHQAEKDLELSWEDIETIQEMANKYCKHHSCEPRFFVYKEVLKQFNKERNRE